MIVTEQITSQYIHAEMTQLYVELERVVRQIFEQAGNKIKPEQQEEIKQEIEGTKYVLDRFKNKYVTEPSSSPNQN
jgi:ElaB/YqjD/DUF883 family membrane-anchored ribosome-binding protein